jgi:Outer membrane protein beta-barrel domain
MVTLYRVLRVIAATIPVALFWSVPAQAQPATRVYAGGSLGTFSVRADEVDGNAPAGGVFGGISFSRYADVEVEVILPSNAFTRSYSGISVSFAPPGSSRAEIERLGVTTRFDKRREITSNVSAVVVLHPPMSTRWTPGLIVGVTNQRARERTTYTPLAIPPGVDPQHPAVIARDENTTRNLGALTVGGNLAIRVTPRLFVVPDLRYDYGSIGDEINNALRTSVRVLWRF